MADYNTSTGNAREKGVGSANKKASKKSRSQNRTCLTVTVCWGLDGFEYGTQVILKRNGIDEEIVELLDQES